MTTGVTGTLPKANGGSGTTGDSIVKGWIQFNGSGVIAIDDSFNVASIEDDGVGIYTINWGTDFANDDYACPVISGIHHTAILSITPPAIQFGTFDTGHNAADTTKISAIAIGDQ